MSNNNITIEAKEEHTDEFGSYEFIWLNTHSNVHAQGTYIGAQILDNLLIFYLVNPVKKVIHCLKAYQINCADKITKDWFVYKETPDKYQVTVISPYTNGDYIFTDEFVIHRRTEDVKILEIKIPYNYIAPCSSISSDN